MQGTHAQNHTDGKFNGQEEDFRTPKLFVSSLNGFQKEYEAYMWKQGGDATNLLKIYSFWRRKKSLTCDLYFQLNISIYSQSSFDLSFNLYPLKAGWQELPEFEIKYNTQDDEQNEEMNAELQSLVNRWMPKKVFILVSIQ